MFHKCAFPKNVFFADPDQFNAFFSFKVSHFLFLRIYDISEKEHVIRRFDSRQRLSMHKYRTEVIYCVTLELLS